TFPRPPTSTLFPYTTLFRSPNVLFHSIDNQESVDNARKLNAQFDGIGPSALDGFVTLLATSKDKLEERFQNVEIRQDGDLGLVRSEEHTSELQSLAYLVCRL